MTASPPWGYPEYTEPRTESRKTVRDALEESNQYAADAEGWLCALQVHM